MYEHSTSVAPCPPPLQRLLHRIDQAVGCSESFLLTSAVLLIALNSIANVVGRFALGQSIYFSEELNQFLILVVTFIGASFAARHGRHIRMTAMYDALGVRPRKLLMLAISLLTAAVMFYLCYYSILYVMKVERIGRVTPALQWPMYLTFIVVPVGFFMMGVQYCLTFIRNLMHREVYHSFHEMETKENDSPEQSI
ncbi:TRAP transporter small permease [Marinobacterium arenosum]|uniref:TRAP transporter small permease n=1 Tax=Marinobacterium arenosum TaxID=2862496 RepID=UPI001C98741E|nr:TRAP transporter small permease [Marinobacterium arenosum]MBY4678336.1 TRAP transporter small permease [Marinobacterium arenosum]